MFRIKLAKFKQIIAEAITPSFFVRDTKPIRNKLNNCTLDVFAFARTKSTDSGSKDGEIEKQRQILDKCYGDTPHASEPKNLKDDSSEMEKEHKNIEPTGFVRLSNAEKYDIPIASDDEPSQATGEVRAEASVKATTASLAEETLDQKLEIIDETPNIEASSQKNEGFHSIPKILGHNTEFFADEKIQKIDLDDLAKRCTGAPIGNIDDILIKEMKNIASNDIKKTPDMNLIKSHGVEKYYSAIYDHFSEQTKKTQKVDDIPKETIHLIDESTIEEKEIKSERITPLHVDGVHLFPLAEELKDYKETVFLRESPVYLSSEIEEPLLDLQNIINPYDRPIIPFYEYVNKEHVIEDEFDKNETITITETATDTESIAEIPRGKEEVFLNKEDVPGPVIEKHEMDPVVSEPTLTHIVKPNSEKKLKEQNTPRGFGSLSRERLLKLLYLYKNSTDKKTAESHVFSTSAYIPPAPINPSPNSSISAAMGSEVANKESSQDIEMPPNSAISANQNPGEYYNIYLNERQASNLKETLQTLTADNNIIHAFCAQLQEMEDGGSKETEDSIIPLEYPVPFRDPFSCILYEPDVKNNIVIKAVSNKVTSTTMDDTNPNEDLPLSQLLKTLRNKNRLEFCQNLLLENAKLKASKKFTCMVSMDSNKQGNFPPPCKPPPPKPPTTKEKCPKSCPPPQPPCQKPPKNPCANLVPFFLNTIIRVDIPFDAQVPIKKYNGICYYNIIFTDEIIRLRKLGKTLQYFKRDLDTKYIKDVTCAREFEPWIPVPSWPAPKVEKKRPFVCPKEGCKPIPTPRPNSPKQEPGLGVPKKFFSFSKACLSAVHALILKLFNYS